MSSPAGSEQAAFLPPGSAINMSIVMMDRTKQAVVSPHYLIQLTGLIGDHIYALNIKGFAKLKKIKIRDNYGSVWVGPGLNQFFLEIVPE